MTEKMKPSGIGWIKDIPESWKTSKVKFLATEPGTLFLDGDWIESNVIEESGIRYLTSGNVGAGFYKDQGSGHISEKTFNELHCLKVFPGDLMISRLNEPIGRACIVPEGEPCYVVAVDNVILRPNKEYDRKFIMYAMNTEGYAEHGNMIARGATMSRVSRSQLGQFWLAFPGITEQRAIADFLDVQCTKIDRVIADIEKQIETLQKYKKSLITEAVTKGLDQSVPMKDSGFDWVPQIPTSWGVDRLGNISNLRNGYVGPTKDILVDEGEPYIQSLHVKNGKIVFGEDFYVTATWGKHHPKIAKGDILLVQTGEIGQIALVDERYDGCNCHALIICSPDAKRVYPSYLLYYLMSSVGNSQLMIYETGTTLKHLNSTKIKNSKVIIPPVEVQNNIADFLDVRTKKIDAIIETKQKQMETMLSHKKSLIYEYVTGKKRVTEVN